MNERRELSFRRRTAPRTPRCHQKHQWVQQPKTEQMGQQPHQWLSLRRKRRVTMPAPRTRLKTKQKKRRVKTTEPSTQRKMPQLMKTKRKKMPRRTTQPKKPLRNQLQQTERRHHCKKVLAKSEGNKEGHHDFTEVGVSPERTQPVISVRAFGQVTCL